MNINTQNTVESSTDAKQDTNLTVGATVPAPTKTFKSETAANIHDGDNSTVLAPPFLRPINQEQDLHEAGVSQASNVSSSRIKELEETVNNALQAQHTSGLKAGEALSELKEQKAYKDYKPGVKTTFADYSKDVFGITPQYANLLIKAWKCYVSVKKHYEELKQGDVFDQLPKTLDFWVQLSKFKDEKHLDVLNNLIDNYQKEGHALDRISAVEVKDANTPAPQAKPKGPTEGDLKIARDLATKMLKAISKDQDLLSELLDLLQRATDEFAKAMREELLDGYTPAKKRANESGDEVA